MGSSAWAAPPPGVDLSVPDPWDAAARAVLDGPPGCHEVVGRASWSYDAGRFGSARGDAVFVGRLVDGVWLDLRVEPLGERRWERGEGVAVVFDTEPRFLPLLGRHAASTYGEEDPEGGRGRGQASEPETPSPTNAIERVLSELEGSAETVWVTWREAVGAVELVRVVPLGPGSRAAEAEIRVRFPGGGPSPDRLDILFPPSFSVPVGPVRARIESARAEATVRPLEDGSSFPAAEAYSFVASAWGVTFTAAQSVHYTRAVRCP